MAKRKPALFKGRHFEAEIIILCARWYLRFGLSLRDLEELMAERNLQVASGPQERAGQDIVGGLLIHLELQGDGAMREILRPAPNLKVC